MLPPLNNTYCKTVELRISFINIRVVKLLELLLTYRCYVYGTGCCWNGVLFKEFIIATILKCAVLYCLARGRFHLERIFIGNLCIRRKGAWKSFGGYINLK